MLGTSEIDSVRVVVTDGHIQVTIIAEVDCATVVVTLLLVHVATSAKVFAPSAPKIKATCGC